MEPQLHDQLFTASRGAAVAQVSGYVKPMIRPQRMRKWHSPLERAVAAGRVGNHFSARDIYSTPQFIADTIFIVALAIGSGMAFDAVVRHGVSPVLDFVLIGIAIAMLFGWIGRLLARHRSITTMATFDRLRDALEVWTFAFAAFVFVLFVFKEGASVSRGTVMSLYVIGLPAIAAWRVLSPLAIGRLAQTSGKKDRECIVIGDAADTLLDKFVSELKSNGYPAPDVLKFRAACLPALWNAELKSLSVRVAEVARNIGAGEIYICAGAIPSERLAAVGRTLAIIPRAIFVVPDAQTSSLVRCKAAAVGQHVALEFRREPLGTVQRVLKRLMDAAAAGIALILLAPLFAVVSLAIKLDSKGPVFFRQTRNGYQGKPFKIWKFRSMRVQEDGPAVKQAQRNDPRVTRVGRFLRKSSIDELPQLINILVGDMSLVGPRPHAQAHDALYARSIEHYEVRQHVKPGLTGWAQVNGLRGETATLDLMYRRIEYDLWYAVNASVLLDIEILVRTAIEIFRDKNAY